MWELCELYDSILELVGLPTSVQRLVKLVLRRVYDKEENEEIIGIARATGIQRHLVVA